jgi:hypothetical protein
VRKGQEEYSWQERNVRAALELEGSREREKQELFHDKYQDMVLRRGITVHRSTTRKLL